MKQKITAGELMRLTRHFEQSELDPKDIKALGGPEEARKAKALLDSIEPTLPECPFCGAPGKIVGTVQLGSPCVRVKCSECGCGTYLFFPGIDIFTKKEITLQQAINQAIDRWSRRKGKGPEVSHPTTDGHNEPQIPEDKPLGSSSISDFPPEGNIPPIKAGSEYDPFKNKQGWRACHCLKPITA